MASKEPRRQNAFPGMEESAFGQDTGHYHGMTLRDYYAAKAMQGICADGHTFWDSSSIQGEPSNIARLSFEIADAMLKQREL